ncbi:MAG TPA: DUF4202 family protein [Deltaproteobacteria bacterium]|nr:MAG: hypothetical protein DRG83_04430 [Deltaproteobacteria bacterium]HEC31128.1 DUF4202 family protein [Deltaproteobacteria bacterium]
MNSLSRLKQEIRKIIAGSSVPEDPLHAENTVQWVKKLKPDADEALIIAALAHDIERAIEDRKVKKSLFSDYDEFKEAHALNSARIIKEIMLSHGVERQLIDEVYRLVRFHEKGGDPRTDVLRDADALSFFEVNMPFYYEREGFENTLERCLWGFRRISGNNRAYLKTLRFKDKDLQKILEILLRDHSPESAESLPICY